MTSSRDAILAALRRAPGGDVPLPDLAARPEPRGDLATRFASALEAAGGRCVRVADSAALDEALAALPAFATAQRRCSLLPGSGGPGFALDEVDDVHSLDDVGFALLPGEFGVAENGAVWVTDAGLRHRGIFHLAEHVGLVVDAGQIVDDLHAAYARVELAARGFGCFIAGPSKTADIEQALVIGAHGPRSLTVFLREG